MHQEKICNPNTLSAKATGQTLEKKCFGCGQCGLPEGFLPCEHLLSLWNSTTPSRASTRKDYKTDPAKTIARTGWSFLVVDRHRDSLRTLWDPNTGTFSNASNIFKESCKV